MKQEDYCRDALRVAVMPPRRRTLKQGAASCCIATARTVFKLQNMMMMLPSASSSEYGSQAHLVLIVTCGGETSAETRDVKFNGLRIQQI